MQHLWHDRATEPPALLRYGVALLVSALALLLTVLFRTFVAQNLFLFFFAALAVSSWYGGLGPGLLTTLFSSMSVTYLFIHPPELVELDAASFLRLGVFVLVALLISSLPAVRQRAAIMAQAQSEQLHVTLASIGDAVIAADIHGHVTLMNPAAEQLTGWTAAEALGRPIGEVFRTLHEQTRAPAPSPLVRVLSEHSGNRLASSAVLLARDGSERPIDDSAAPIRDSRGKLIGVVLVFRDISARKRIEAEQAQLAAIVESSNDAIIGKTLDGTIVSWNAGAERMYGYLASEAIGRSIQMIAPADHPDEIPQILARLKTGERIERFETLRVRKDGVTITVALTISPIKDASGTIIGASAIARDVTASKRAALRTARLRESAAALSEALTPKQVAAVILQQGLGALDAQAGLISLLDASEQALAIMGSRGYVDEELDPWRYLPLTSSTALVEAVRTRTPVLIETRATLAERFPAVAPSPLTTGFHSWAALPLLVNGRAIGGMSLAFAQPRIFDEDERVFMLTLASQCAQALERARLYDAERQARASAEAAVRLRDQFLSIAAHELKTPLTSLIGYAQLFKRRAERAGNLSAVEQRTITVIAEQAQRLNKMVAALLDISRIESGQLSITKALFDLCALARRVVEETRLPDETRQIELSCPAAPLMIMGDELRIEQVLQNLLQNALKYSPNGAPVWMRITCEGHHVLVAVEDRGIGIPSAAIPQLFQRFYRAPNIDDRQISGMGIGLYVVKEIIGLHGGAVSVESNEGVGSTFTVCLPLVGDRE